jgi:hypothetical protein
MVSYQGPAELVDERGGVLASVEVAYKDRQYAGGVRSWSGEVLKVRWGIPRLGEYTLRLPNGAAGRVIVRHISVTSRGRHIGLKGTGPPPAA